MNRLRTILHTLCLCLLSGLPLLSNAQAKLNLGDSYLVMDGGSSALPVYLTVDNAATDAIMHSGSGHIITSAEHQKIKWFIGAATGNYMFPIGKGASFIPFTFDITVPGSSDGSVIVSSWYSPANAIAPEGGYVACPDENSAMDRFWTINTNDYTTNPTADIRFYYIDDIVELDAIDETQLVAQRGNAALLPGCPWEYPVGIVNPTDNYVEVTAVNAFSPWTLSFEASPLPIVLLYFEAEWKNQEQDVAVIDWLTTAEINNDYFVVERSADGQNFYSINTVDGAGTSLESNYYTIYDNNPLQYQTSYYRLQQVDYNGAYSYSDIAVLTSDMEPGAITVFPNPFDEHLFYSLYNDRPTAVDIVMYNELGSVVMQYRDQLPQGDIRQPLPVSRLYPGAYMLIIRTVNDNPRLVKELITTVVKINQ